MLRIIDRYTIRDFVPPFLACVAGFTVVLLSGIVYELTDLIFSNRMPVSVVLQLLVYKVPQIVVVTLPIAVLFATLLSLGRMVREFEITAIRSAGVSFRRAMVPVVITGLAVSAFSLFLYESVVPEANHRAENLYRSSLFRDTMPGIRENVFFRGTGDRFFYVGEVDGNTNRLHHVLIYETGANPYPAIISARAGTFSDSVWYLTDGVSRTFDEAGHTVHEVVWDSLEYHVPEGESVLFGTQKTTDEMTRAELREHIELFRRSGIEVRRFEVDYHMKLAMPLASLLWITVGAPLSLCSGRGGRFFGVVVAIVVAFVYFVSSAVFRSLGGNGLLPPLLAAWGTNLIYLVLGVVLVVRADRAG